METNSNNPANCPKTDAIVTCSHFFAIFHEEYDPLDGVTFHTQMCIIDETFQKILNSDDIQKLFAPITEIYVLINDLFTSLLEKEWDQSYNSILKFLEHYEYSDLPKLKIDLAEAEQIVEDIMDNEEEEEELYEIHSSDEEEFEESSDEEERARKKQRNMDE